jgi:hypothetical protein
MRELWSSPVQPLESNPQSSGFYGRVALRPSLPLQKGQQRRFELQRQQSHHISPLDILYYINPAVAAGGQRQEQSLRWECARDGWRLPFRSGKEQAAVG